ncbi:hypothetical protein KAJ41_02275 [Candidatus Parcubacteria bacterium]|nr:hypothetical protein [Candidatus Parcubacteria bacterium]
MKTSNLVTNLLMTSSVVFILSLVVFELLGIEIAIIFSISLLTGFIMTGFVGIENVIILAKNDKKDYEE